tara:strand:- start:2304 stop:4127 length:1824 start_codon:yes stop_codon:yes gene_type:complete
MKDINLPELPPDMDIPEDVKNKLSQLKTKVDKFKKVVLKKFGEYIVGIALLPPERLSQQEEQELSEKEKKERAEEINLLVLIDDVDSKKLSKVELIEQLNKSVGDEAKEIDEKLKPEVLVISELKEMCFDGKYEILEMIGLSALIYDKGMLGALKTAEIHKNMAIKKFERYILSYIAIGSLFRGDANPGDIDVTIVVDDTDVKKMSRIELKERLRAIIQDMGFQASKISGVKAVFHVQTHILTDFWDNIKDASPVIYTFLRDGVPLFDRGVFMPWKLLLQMGRVKPSPEAIDMSMDSGERFLERSQAKLLGIIGEDLYYAVMNPAQAAIMLYGFPPTTPRETIKMFDEIFVKKEKLLEKKYVDILARLFKFYKDLEHGDVKDVTGKEIDKILKDVKDYIDRIRKLFTQIEKKTVGESVLHNYDSSMAIARDALYFSGVKEINLNKIDKLFKENLVDKGLIPDKFLRILQLLIKSKKEYDAKKLNKAEIEKINKEARLFIRSLVDFIQRQRGVELDRAKVRFKYGNKFGEVLLLDKIAFITDDLENKEEVNKALLKNGSLQDLEKSSLEELEKNLKNVKIPKDVFIKEKIFEDLRKLYGKDVEILVSS